MSDEVERFYRGMAERDMAWLDVRYPGWWRSIDTGRLDLTRCEDCVAGQMFPGRIGMWGQFRLEAREDGVELSLASPNATQYVAAGVEARRARELREAFAVATAERLLALGLERA